MTKNNNNIIIEGLKNLNEIREAGERLSQDVFYSYCESVIACPVEIVPITNLNKVLMFKRDVDDKYFSNLWHTPGSIQLPRETIKTVLDRILNQEMKGIIKIGEPIFAGVLENNKGLTDLDCVRGQERSIVFIQKISENFEKNSTTDCFEFDNIPKDSLTFQRIKLIPKVEKFLKDGMSEITYA